jgi:predicted amino acid-binding ACT domain protein
MRTARRVGIVSAVHGLLAKNGLECLPIHAAQIARLLNFSFHHCGNMETCDVLIYGAGGKNS